MSLFIPDLVRLHNAFLMAFQTGGQALLIQTHSFFILTRARTHAVGHRQTHVHFEWKKLHSGFKKVILKEVSCVYHKWSLPQHVVFWLLRRLRQQLFWLFRDKDEENYMIIFSHRFIYTVNGSSGVLGNTTVPINKERNKTNKHDQHTPCVGLWRPISMGALRSMLVDDAETTNETSNIPTKLRLSIPNTKPQLHLQLSPLRYDSRSFLSGLLTTGMFSVYTVRILRDLMRSQTTQPLQLSVEFRRGKVILRIMQ